MKKIIILLFFLSCADVPKTDKEKISCAVSQSVLEKTKIIDGSDYPDLSNAVWKLIDKKFKVPAEYLTICNYILFKSIPDKRNKKDLTNLVHEETHVLQSLEEGCFFNSFVYAFDYALRLVCKYSDML